MKLNFYPHLVQEWHPTKNGGLTPEGFTHASHKKVWRWCFKGHSFDSVPNSRTSRQTECPHCSGRRTLN